MILWFKTHVNTPCRCLDVVKVAGSLTPTLIYQLIAGPPRPNISVEVRGRVLFWQLLAQSIDDWRAGCLPLGGYFTMKIMIMYSSFHYCNSWINISKFFYTQLSRVLLFLGSRHFSTACWSGGVNTPNTSCWGGGVAYRIQQMLWLNLDHIWGKV